MSATIRTPEQVAAHFGADYDPQADHHEMNRRISRRIYKTTSCGAWAEVVQVKTGEVWVFRVGSIVEGIDAEVAPEEVTLPCTPADLDRAVEAVEDAATLLWNETHGCDDCGEELSHGYRAINPECPSCGGEGIII